MENSKWLGAGEISKEQDKQKLPHVKEVKVTADMPDGQKEFARVFNEMRVMLIENNLMNKK